MYRDDDADNSSAGNGSSPKESLCHRFEMAAADDDVPELLRRIAARIDSIKGFELLDIVMEPCFDEVAASVYYDIGEG